jgi:hypothetical protein
MRRNRSCSVALSRAPRPSNRGFIAVASSRVHPDATPVENTPVRTKPHPELGAGMACPLWPYTGCFQRWRSASIVATWCLLHGRFNASKERRDRALMSDLVAHKSPISDPGLILVSLWAEGGPSRCLWPISPTGRQQTHALQQKTCPIRSPCRRGGEMTPECRGPTPWPSSN